MNPVRTAIAPAAIALTVMLSAAPGAARSPTVDYMVNCQGCHLSDGRGTPGKVPSLRGELGKFLWVDEGRSFLVQVPGTANSKLDDAETAALLNWLIEKMGPAQAYQPFTGDEVSRLRSKRLHDVIGTRKRIMAKIEAVERTRRPTGQP